MSQLNFVNGRRYSHSSIELTLWKKTVNISEIFIDFDNVEYEDSLDMGEIRGANRAIIGLTEGDYSCKDTVFSLGKSTFQNGIVDAIGTGWMGSELQATLAYNAPGEPLTIDVIRCFISGAADSSSAGPDGLKTKMTCKTLWISRNNFMAIPNIPK